MSKLFLLFIFATTLNNLVAQNSSKNQIKVKQIGNRLNDGFLNLKRTSKKIYYYNKDGSISKVKKYGRHHYFYLKVVGQITNYSYQDKIVISIDSTYCCEDDNIVNVTTDTINKKSFIKIPSFDSKNFILDSENRLIESKYRNRVTKYLYDKDGFIEKISIYYSDNLEQLSNY